MYLQTVNPSPDFGTALVQRTMMKPRRGGVGCACSGALPGLNGLGLFDSGTDISGWGPMEWAVVALGGFALFSMFSTTKRGVSGARKSIKARSSRKRRRAQLERELGSL
jgi:hypothetical protein